MSRMWVLWAHDMSGKKFIMGAFRTEEEAEKAKLHNERIWCIEDADRVKDRYVQEWGFAEEGLNDNTSN